MTQAALFFENNLSSFTYICNVKEVDLHFKSKKVSLLVKSDTSLCSADRNVVEPRKFSKRMVMYTVVPPCPTI